MKQIQNNTPSLRSRIVWGKFKKLQKRLQTKIADGSFQMLSHHKRQRLLATLRRYAQHLQRAGFRLKKTTAILALSFAAATALEGQAFVQQLGDDNPLFGFVVSSNSIPTFVDIDNDGDFDVFSGDGNGTISLYENRGTNTHPHFNESGETFTIANPLSAVDVGSNSTPTFVDIDNDGDFDVFSGEEYGEFRFYENTGTNASPIFTEQTGAANPLNAFDVGIHSTPTFVDIDNDGDFDAFSGELYGEFTFYENTGTNASPNFTEQTGAANPLDAFDIEGAEPNLNFVDIDNDGDFDAFIGDFFRTFRFYENTGTNTSPVFTEQAGAANPLNAFNVGYAPSPTFVDIDDDGDFDSFSGDTYGRFHFFLNDSALPTALTAFTARQQDKRTNLLQWETAAEENNEGFEVQKSRDGEAWEVLDFVPGSGIRAAAQSYTYSDRFSFAGVNYYRLKQVDVDGSFAYSAIVTVQVETNGEKITIYPNPVQEELTIAGVGDLESIVIYNAQGRVVKRLSAVVTSLSIDTSVLPKGVYMLWLRTVDGVVVAKSFVK
jgi:hypothetical protein